MLPAGCISRAAGIAALCAQRGRNSGDRSGNSMSYRSIRAAASLCEQSAVKSSTMTRTVASAPWLRRSAPYLGSRCAGTADRSLRR